MEEGRLRTTPEALRRRFGSEQPMRIAIEAGTHSPWVSRVLEECGHEVLVANARKLRLIYANKRKTDEVDAENLARLARLDPKLLYPLKHRGEDSQAHMAIIRSRQALVGARTQLVNHVRGAVKSFGARLPKCPARSFHKRASEHIPEALLPALGPILEQIGSLTERIRDYERQLEAISKGKSSSTILKPSSCARSRESEGSRRLPSCLPWRTPTASKGAARWGRTWGWCQPQSARERGILRDASPRRATRCSGSCW